MGKRSRYKPLIDKNVGCGACGKPIRIDCWGGRIMIKGIDYWFHNWDDCKAEVKRLKDEQNT